MIHHFSNFHKPEFSLNPLIRIFQTTFGWKTVVSGVKIRSGMEGGEWKGGREGWKEIGSCGGFGNHSGLESCLGVLTT